MPALLQILAYVLRICAHIKCPGIWTLLSVLICNVESFCSHSVLPPVHNHSLGHKDPVQWTLSSCLAADIHCCTNTWTKHHQRYLLKKGECINVQYAPFCSNGIHMEGVPSQKTYISYSAERHRSLNSGSNAFDIYFCLLKISYLTMIISLRLCVDICKIGNAKITWILHMENICLFVSA